MSGKLLVTILVLIHSLEQISAKISPELIWADNARNVDVTINEQRSLLSDNNRMRDNVRGKEINDVTKDKDNSEYDATKDQNTKKGNWVILTSKYTKKLRVTDFRRKSFDKLNFMGNLHLEQKWKKQIIATLEEGERSVKPAENRRPILKNGNNEITILSNDATIYQSDSVSQVNITCPKRIEYTCQFEVVVPHVAPCWFDRRYQCSQNRKQFHVGTCSRDIQVCCPGFELKRNGYCGVKLPDPTFPPSPSVPPATFTPPGTQESPTRSRCGGLLTSKEGQILSPNYPDIYPDEKKCKWHIFAPRGHKVILKVIDIGIEDPVGACDLRNWNCFKLCEFDQLKITDLNNGRVQTLCGHLAPSTHFVSEGNNLEVAFSSDLSSGGKGFKIVYATVPDRVLSKSAFCPGGATWQTCRQRCVRTCFHAKNNSSVECKSVAAPSRLIASSRLDEITCVPGCACPASAPIWHNGVCVKPEKCPGNFFKCGIPAVTSKAKIVGGRAADKHAWPWMVQIESDSIFHICGATLICSNWVVTAAHCFLNLDRTDLETNVRRYLVNVGKYWKNEQKDGRKVQTYEPLKIVIHPDYNITNDLNDIALIKLTHAVDVTDHVRPACLPNVILPGLTSESSFFAKYQVPKKGTVCTVLGWGTTRNIGPTSAQLKQAKIQIRPGKSCVYDSYDWTMMICAGGKKNEDTCRGDSGGPLLCKRKGKWFLDGVTSYGDACGDEKIAGGYTRISNYVKWIRSKVGWNCLL